MSARQYFIFNPDTEMALAAGSASYTPPAAVQRFAARLSLLPALYAPEGSAVLLPSADPGCAISSLPYYNICRQRGIPILPLCRLEPAEVHPWGWNKALRTQLAAAGMPPSSLPGDSRLEIIRNLAHRRTTCLIFRSFADERLLAMKPVCFDNAHSAGQYVKALNDNGYEAVAKMPWSSSGRGVFFNPDARTLGRLMSRQGGVMIEPRWRKALDFASEWRCSGGEVAFQGYSLFENSANGNYSGNLVAGQQHLRSRILGYCNEDALRRATEDVCRALRLCVAPSYEGPLGVDMLCDTEGRINPCVEINLRMTMGHVALHLYRLFGLPGGVPYHFYPGKDLPFG